MGRPLLVKIVRVPEAVWQAHLAACGTDMDAVKDHSRFVHYPLAGREWAAANYNLGPHDVGVDIFEDDIAKAEAARGR